jgi:CRISPR-associated protein Csd1
MEIISNFPGEENKPLDSTYLLGYYLQRNALYAKKNDNEEE